MKFLLRHPTLYLVFHWSATIALALVFLVPRHTGMPAGASVTLLTGQVVRVDAAGTPRPASGLIEIPGAVSALAGAELIGTPPGGYFVTPRGKRVYLDSVLSTSSGDAERMSGKPVSPFPNVSPAYDDQVWNPSEDLAPSYLAGYEGDSLAGDAFAIPVAAYGSLGVFFDPRLFDISYLEQNGYDDQHTDRVPVIVAFATHDLAVNAARKGIVDGGIHLTHAFEYGPFAMGYVSKHGPFVPVDAWTPGATTTVTIRGTGFATATHTVVTFNSPYSADGSLSATTNPDGITGIYLDAVESLAPGDTGATSVAPALDSALPLIGAPAAHARGLNGKGIKIAVVDTGIDGNHPDLQGRVVAARNFSTDLNTNDQNGHGTHVAGIAAGTGAASDGKYGGVAPQALLINAKALSRAGGGTESGIMRAMEWAADQGARIENMSLGGGQSDGTDPLSREVNSITQQKNVLFVIAAGNSGTRQKVSTPAAADMSLAVGAVDKQGSLAYFSSRGPRYGDMALKPDIVAPGVDITAPRANPGDGNPYIPHSGTSMASPMVAGSAALVMQLHPDWTAVQVKNALMSSASPIGGDTNSLTTACGGSADDQLSSDPCAWLVPMPSVQLTPCSSTRPDSTGNAMHPATCWVHLTLQPKWPRNCSVDASGSDSLEVALQCTLKSALPLLRTVPCSTGATAVARLCGAADDGYVSAYDQGAGLVNLATIVDQAAVAEPAGLSFGRLSAGSTVSKSITLHNISSAPLAVRVTVSVHGPDGAVVGGGSVSEDQLVIPSGGSAPVEVTIQAPSTQGAYSGDVVFTDMASGQRVARAALAFVAEKGS